MSRRLWQSATQNLPALWLTDELTPQTTEQLIHFSATDPQVVTNTHDQVRFANDVALKDWLSKGKELFVLETEAGDLRGLAWVSHKTSAEVPLPSYSLTFGIRLYDSARGKGLAIPFLKTLLDTYKNSEEKFWLATKA